jgi:competence protein ComEA
MDRSATPWRALDTDPAVPEDARATEAGPATVVAGFGGAWLAFAALAVSGVFAVGAFALVASDAGTVTIDGGTDLAASGDVDPAIAASGGVVVVEVAGAVVRPGVYRLPAGTRIGEAIDTAGGYGPRLDTARARAELNLAAVVADGDRVVVPSRDDAPAAAAVEGAPGSGAADGLVDLNTASQAELEELPGIGPVTATKIIAAREEQPFAAVDDLRDRKLVGEKTYASLVDLITVH